MSSLAYCRSVQLFGNYCLSWMTGKMRWTRVRVYTYSCFLDMAKAFEKVNHSLLLLKLRSVGLQSTELAWFKSYLTGRSICTAVDGVHSAAKYISSGVPQGSVLGPLLFIIFYRDLPSITSSETAMFADDTQLHARCTFFSTDWPAVHLSCKVQDDLRTNQRVGEMLGHNFQCCKVLAYVTNAPERSE